MRAVDTNVLVRLVTRDDAAQVRAAEAFIEPGAWVSHIVLAGMTWVLEFAYDLDHAAIATAVQMLLSHRSLTVQDGDVVLTALQTYSRSPPLGFSDCLVLEIARKAGHVPLGTFDRKLARVPGAQRL